MPGPGALKGDRTTEFRLPEVLQSWGRKVWAVALIAIRNLIVKGNVSQATNKLNSTYRFDRESGLIALRQFSMIVLQRGLKERDRFEQCYAASAFAEGGENEALQMMADTFQTDPDLSLKMAVADGLGEVGDRKAVAILGHLYYHGEMLDRRFIINALSSATDPSAVVVLSDAVKQSSDPSLRLAALKGLGKVGNRDAMPLLKLALAKGRAFERVTAAESLLLMGDNSGVEMLRAT